MTAAQSYAKRTTEERINTSLANARVSGLRIAQLATPPDFPAFPQPIIFPGAGPGREIVLPSAAALLPEALACVGTYDAVSRGSTEAATDVRQRAAETARRLTTILTLEQNRAAARSGAALAGGLKPRCRKAPGRQSPLWQSCTMIRSRLRGKLMGRSVGPAIRHRLRPRRCHLAQPSARTFQHRAGAQARRERQGAVDLCQSLGTPANNAIQKFMDQNTGPQLFVATVAAVALKNHWNDKAFVRVILDQPIITLAMTRATRAKRGVFRPVYPKRA